MDVIIEGTGETKQLRYMVNGINIAADFVGNNSIVETDDDGNRLMSADDYAYWVDTIAAHEQMDALIAKYEERHGPDEVEEAIQRSHALGYDLHDQPRMVRQALTDWFDAPRNAAAVLGRKGGSVRSERKAAASAENGRKGGRPRKPQAE